MSDASRLRRVYHLRPAHARSGLIENGVSQTLAQAHRILLEGAGIAARPSRMALIACGYSAAVAIALASSLSATGSQLTALVHSQSPGGGGLTMPNSSRMSLT